MSTPFPINDYPLLQGEKPSTNHVGVSREMMSDGTPKVWVLSDTEYATISLAFSPLNENNASALVQYLYDNRANEMSIDFHGDTFVGYFWSETEVEKKNNQWWITVDFYGRKTL